MKLEEWKRSGKYLQYQNWRIFHKVEGSGKNLVLIHGFPTASWDWEKIWEPLSKKYRLIALDMLGFGFSSKPSIDYSIFLQADIIEKLLNELGLEEATVLAHDLGDTVAQELLARFIDRKKSGVSGFKIQRMILLNGGIFPESHRPRLIQKLLHSPLGWVLSRLINRGSFQKSFSAVFGENTKPSSAELEDFWNLVSSDEGTKISHRLIRYIAERKTNRERWVGALLNSPVPIRMINGVDDPVSGAHLVTRYKQLVPNADIVELKGIGHYPQVEAPSEVLKAIP
ncbi:alpha/beta hydrolase [Leptospira gomenensis]|uniref:Alpha/beta hydrolase n=1 Tax=Leptospira gomenensis TaxID=2484974 RepID=A0A5F1YN22_9LEPT|nr:alpha/beta hydrolase [Leptospira gomenensis]TGK32699.1 alpha/beta hydrolase [Leptospira gomenensis]TGK36846.1 alpha/beta hydrolase [Leptospira gomenensis]TGK39922.1 alpha/beta hydrolase [Leptospira gomenensis]TGK58057.1 alpha/beta hydrolase [Leptospira gomenensis]